MAKTTNSQNQAETRDFKVMLLIGMTIMMSLGFLITPASSDSCPPGPKMYGSSANIWTPQLLLDSPYLGSATGFSGVQEELDYNFLVTGAVKIDQQGWLMSRQNGEASGVFEVGTWQEVSQTTGCTSTLHTGAQFNGYYLDPSINNQPRITTEQLAPPGTTSDASVINQFSYLGFDSMTFDMRYAKGDADLTTPGGSVTATASGDCGWAGCGACGVIYNCTFFNPQVSIGAFGVSGNIEMKYASTQTYDYSYSFPGGYEWQWNYKSSPNYLMAFSFVGVCSGCGGGGGGGGGSPWIGVLEPNGQYNFLNNILRGGMFSTGQPWHDFTDYYVLPIAGAPSNGQYIFEIFERNTATNYFDSFVTYAIDHPAGVSVLATLDGKILTYRNPAPALSVLDLTSGTPFDVTSSLSNSLLASQDGSYIVGSNGHTLYADFGSVQSSTAKLILAGENAPELSQPIPGACNPFCKQAIVAYVQTKGGWTYVGKLFPRVGGSIEGLDLSSFTKANGETHLKVKLVYMGGEKVSFVGLDTSPNADVSVSNMPLTQALLGSQGDVASNLTGTDGNYSTLGPLQLLRIVFTTNPPSSLVRDIMIVSTGHYIT